MTNELAAELLDKVVNIAGRVSGIMRAGIETLDLTEPLANLVWLLDPNVDPVSLRKLAARLHCDPSNISQLSVQLEQRGFAERRPHPRDRRVRTLVLTPDGMEIRQRLVALVTARSPLSALDDAEQRQLNTILAKALAAI
jgi:MarR family transcriptional regulator, organic hydroperoxide resistance regulator